MAELLNIDCLSLDGGCQPRATKLVERIAAEPAVVTAPDASAPEQTEAA